MCCLRDRTPTLSAAAPPPSILASALEHNQITYVRLDAKLRQQAILRFRTDPDVKACGPLSVDLILIRD